MSLKKRAVLRALRKKGLVESESRHKMLVLMVDGRASRISTHVSHGPEETLSEALVTLMAHQCHLSVPEFREVVGCPLTGEAYVELVRKKGLI